MRTRTTTIGAVLAVFPVPLPASAHGEHKVDKCYTSIEDGFDEVTDPAEVQYPAAEPTGSQQTTRLDRETARLNAAPDAQQAVAGDRAADARRLATIGLVVGALGLLPAVGVGVVALRRRS